MVKHIILWKLKEDLADKDSVKAEIKKGLEGLQGKITSAYFLWSAMCALIALKVVSLM